MALVTLGGAPAPFDILYNPAKELNGDLSGWSAVMGFRVPLANYLPFVTYVAGRSYAVTTGAGTFTRIIPMSHPDFPGLICTKIQTKGTGQISATGQFSWFRVTATFTMVPYNVDGSAPFQTIEATYSTKTYSIANTSFTFSDGTPSTASSFIAVPEIGYVVTLYQCTQLDDALLGTLIAAPLNNNTFFGWPAKTIFLEGMKASLNMASVGTPTYTRVVQFKYRPIDWNKFLRTDGQWDTCLNVAGDPAYQQSDLSQILQ